MHDERKRQISLRVRKGLRTFQITRAATAVTAGELVFWLDPGDTMLAVLAVPSE